MIDSETIRRKAADEIALDENTDVFPDREAFFDAMASSKTKFITVGRFSPEKGHKRLISAFRRYHAEHGNCCLIIMGGYSVGNGYEETADWIRTNGMEDSVILLHRVSNPYPVIRSCDGFILSSFYEGFGLVIAEADILGIPVVATDIAGPRTFMREHGGTMVESSEEGIYEGLCLLGAKQVPTMSVDYKTYNRDAIREFEALIR